MDKTCKVIKSVWIGGKPRPAGYECSLPYSTAVEMQRNGSVEFVEAGKQDDKPVKRKAKGSEDSAD